MNLSAFARLAGVGLALCIAPMTVRADTLTDSLAITCGAMKYTTGLVRGSTQDLAGQRCNSSPANIYTNITTGTTTTVKAGAGTFHTLTINTYVASATITIYDNTAASGTKIGTLTLPGTITSDVPVTLTYDLRFATGLTIVTSGATDITVSSQ